MISETTLAEHGAGVFRVFLSTLGKAFASTLRNGNLGSIADQVLISATNFLTTVIIGRAAGQDALGVYTLAFSVMLIVLSLQESLICLPYTIEHHRLAGPLRQQLDGNVFRLAAILAAIIVLTLGLGALIGSTRGLLDSFDISITVVIAAPFILLRDFARRISFAHLEVSKAIVVDGVVLVLQLSMLLILCQLGILSAATAYLAVAAACAIPGIAWLWSGRHRYQSAGPRLAADARRSWSLGRWIFASQITAILSSYLVYWLVAVNLGTDASGILFACSAIILLSNPIVLGTSTYMAPRLSAALANDGNAGVHRVAVRTTVLLAAVLSIFSVAAYVFGDAFLNTIFGAAYTGNAAVSGLFGLAVLAQSVGIAPDQVLWVKHRAIISFLTGLLGLGCMVVLALLLMPGTGLAGAVLAMLIGSAITSATRWAATLYIVNGQPEGAAA